LPYPGEKRNIASGNHPARLAAKQLACRAMPLSEISIAIPAALVECGETGG
jgi:hypothetical protein